MPERSPTSQLIDLCAGHGAVPVRIATTAPFLRDLPATRHAHEVLYGGHDADWADAARELLICITQPGGAGGLNEQFSRFARACLALNGDFNSFAQRMDGLANDSEYRHPAARNTQTKLRESTMSTLAGVLVRLDSYPCAPGADKRARLELARTLFTVVCFPDFYGYDEESKRGLANEFVEELMGAKLFFDRVEPTLGVYERLQIMATAVAARTYRQVYEDLKPRSVEQLVEPELIPQLFEDRPLLIDRSSPEVEASLEILARIFLDIEEESAWERVLLAVAAAESEFELTTGQSLRIRAYFERFSNPS